MPAFIARYSSETAQAKETCAVILSVYLVLFPVTQSQLNLDRSKSRMGTFVEGGPMAETNPDEGYELNAVCILSVMQMCC